MDARCYYFIGIDNILFVILHFLSFFFFFEIIYIVIYINAIFRL